MPPIITHTKIGNKRVRTVALEPGTHTYDDGSFTIDEACFMDVEEEYVWLYPLNKMKPYWRTIRRLFDTLRAQNEKLDPPKQGPYR